MPSRRSSLTPEYTWQEETGRYRDGGGRFVSRLAVRDALDVALDNSGKQVKALAESLRAGTINLGDWQLQMVREIKSVHLASGALAKGGWAEMSQADYGRVGQRVRGQYEYLRNFAEQIASGEQRLDGTLAQRASLYIGAGRGTYHAVEQREMRLRGMTEERNVLHAGDSCPGCLSADAMGWVALGTLPQIGSRDCLSKCRCSISYR